MRQDRELDAAELQAFGDELDGLRQRTLADLGEVDARYIRRIRGLIRGCALAGRLLLLCGWFPPTWLLGAALLGLAKILENLELGHNVMHGQYDWMNDPELTARSYEWDMVGTADFWQRTHNRHHVYTNVLGMDDDVGYGLARLFPEQRWKPYYRWQPLWVALHALLFQHGLAVQHLRLDKVYKGRVSKEEVRPLIRQFNRKLLRQSAKDYLIFPLLALLVGAPVVAVLLGSLMANLIRNLWVFTVVYCGHFTEQVAVFSPAVLENETRGHWYLRQLRGASNMQGGKVFHILSGNLSHQIEHHLFPDLPARRYAALAIEVQDIARRYGQVYNTGRLSEQFATVLKRIWLYRLPNRDPAPA